MKIISLKNLLLAGILAASAGITSAQSETPARPATTRVITGMVVDKNGNPLSGAEVRATGGAETVYTEADGSFSIEVPVTLKSLTASYTGLRDCRLRTTSYNNMIFTLKDFNRTNGFVSVVGGATWALNNQPAINGAIPIVGLMGGAYRSWGGYFKITMGCASPGFETHPANRPTGDYYYDDDDDSYAHFPMLMGGVIKKLSNKFNVFLGLGAGPNYTTDYYYHQSINNNQTSESSSLYAECYWAPAVELGVMFRHRRINIIAGINYIAPSFDKDEESNHYSGGYSIYKDAFNDGNLSIFVGVGINI